MKEYATVLAFDVKVLPDAQQFADDNGIMVFTANIIYHLFDQFKEYVEKCRGDRKSDEGSKAVFPCVLEMVKGAIFHVKDPLVIGVTVKAGILKIGTPLCIPDKDKLKIGKIESIELNGKPLQTAKPQHGGIAIKIVGDSSITYGRHFDDTNQIVSIISRDSIDALKHYFKDEMGDDDWRLVIQLKKTFGLA